MTFEIFKNSRRGRLNKISDVKGVRVGHSTIKDGLSLIHISEPTRQVR